MSSRTQKRDLFPVRLAVLMVFLSALLYLLHYALFRDAHHIFLYLIGDVAFLPVEVLFVTIIIDRLLARREKEAMMTKMNMVIGIFFSEVGTKLLHDIARADENIGGIVKDALVNNNDWTARGVSARQKALAAYQPDLQGEKIDLAGMKDFLLGQRDFLLRLLENPNLLEHERFTDLLWAVFHLMDELAHRAEFRGLPASDFAHVAGDIKRAYLAGMLQWIDYMKHLNDQYPYLFSLAMRSNPFDPNASVIIKP
jgi:hypothetical protein